MIQTPEHKEAVSMKRWWMVFVSAALALVCMGAVTAQAAESGQCGQEKDTVFWYLSDSGEMTISGAGKMNGNLVFNTIPYDLQK